MSDTKVSYRGGYEQKEREGEMKEKKLLNRLDRFIDAHKSRMQNDYMEFRPAYEKELSMLTEIKQILSEMSCRKPDNELVEKIAKIVLKHIKIYEIPGKPNGQFIELNSIKAEIGKLLQPPDNDLVNEILEISLNVHTDISNIPVSEAYGDKNGYAREDVVIKAKAEICKLLQSRQPEKVTVTNDWIAELAASIREAKDFTLSMEEARIVLKSKGIEVTEK